MKSIGTQIAIDMYNCSDILLDDVIGIEHMLSSAAARFGMEPEYSVFAHCKQGHITMHVYPDMGFATIDIFTCFKEADPDGLARFMRKYFNPDKSKITYLERGDFGNESDMKPRRKSHTKIIRKAKTLGKKLSKLMMRPKSI